VSAKNNRHKALLKGEAKYISDKPCKRGHIGLRVTATGTCIECRIIKSRERYAANPKKAIEKTKEYYKKHSGKIKENRRKKYAQNPEKELITSRKRVAEWRLKNPEKVKAHGALKSAYKKANPHKSAILLAKRRSAKLKRTPKWLNQDDLWMIDQIYELCSLRSKLTGILWHVDHVIPLQGKTVSGLHVPSNLRVILRSENLQKSNKLEQ